MMRRPLMILMALLISAPLFARNHNVSFDDDNGNATDCSALSVRFDGHRIPVTTEQVRIGNPRALRVTTGSNGGIRVVGGSSYSVLACKAVDASLDASSIQVNYDGAEVSASGPDSEDWIVYFIVQTPPNATLDLQANNGPMSVRDFNGTLTAHTQNGPLSIKNSTGSIDASAQNGPVSIAGGGGNVKLSATNGPVSVKLDGTSWDGGTLDASTKNGPVSLKIPRGFRSGVLVESLGGGPVSCRAEDCSATRNRVITSDDDDNDRPRRIELGSGAQVIHLSSVNGPVSIKDRE